MTCLVLMAAVHLDGSNGGLEVLYMAAFVAGLAIGLLGCRRT